MSDYTPRHLAVTPAEPTFGYRAGLDGLRGLSVLAVLLFHHGFTWAGGGFLGVSAFFTLSGFLITGVLLTRETDARMGQRMAIFWRRRARRLLPAAWVAVALTLLLAANGAFRSEGTGGDAIAALANVANWRLVSEGAAYTDLFEAPSAFQQFWSLAIEEQFYVFVPLLLLLVVRRLPVERLLLVVGGLAVASTALMAVLGPGDRSYYGTDTRSAELLIGVAAALAVFSPEFRPTRQLRRRVRRLSRFGLVALLVMWSTLEVDSAFLYRGGFALHALATVAVVGGTFVGGSTERLLSFEPLVRVGKVSYGLYLYHWPIFLWLTPDRTGLDDVPLFAARMAVTSIAALLSYQLIESPVRQRKVLVWPAPLPIGAAVLTALLTVALVAPLEPAGTASAELETAQERFSGDGADASTEPAGADGPLRVGLFGDSTALMTAIGLLEYGEDHPDEIGSVHGSAPFGCTLARAGVRALEPPTYTETPPACVAREADWSRAIARRPIDVAVLYFGPWEVSDHRLSPDDDDLAPGDPYYDAYLAGEMHLATAFFAERDIPVIWLTSPMIEIGVDQTPPPSPAYPGSDDARMIRYNELLLEAIRADRASGIDVESIDLGRFVNEHPDGRPGDRMRPDGVHFTIETSTEVARSFLGPELVEVARSMLAG